MLLQFSQLLILQSLLFNPVLVPFPHHSFLSFAVIHEFIINARAFLLRFLLDFLERIIDLSSLILGIEENFVGSFNEMFLLWPLIRYLLDSLNDLIALQSEHYHLVLQYSELENAIKP